MIKYNNTNNASTTLTAWISASSTTLIVENGDILPTAPFLLTLEHFDNEKVTVREIVKCIAKVGTILTIQRGAWTCVQDDSATPKVQNNTPHSFSVWDCASIYWTSEQVQDIQNEIEKKLNIDDFQAWTYVYGATSTWTDAYSITIPWTLTSYSVGQVFRFMADVDNEWNATLNINGLWEKEILKNHDQHLQSGDIEAGQIVEVAYDGTNFQMDSQIASVISLDDISSLSYNDLTCYAGEDIKENDLIVTNGNSFNPDRTDEDLSVGWTTINKYAIGFIGNGESTDTFSIKTSVIEWFEPDSVTIKIESDDNWKPSWTELATSTSLDVFKSNTSVNNCTTSAINSTEYNSIKASYFSNLGENEWDISYSNWIITVSWETYNYTLDITWVDWYVSWTTFKKVCPNDKYLFFYKSNKLYQLYLPNYFSTEWAVMTEITAKVSSSAKYPVSWCFDRSGHFFPMICSTTTSGSMTYYFGILYTETPFDLTSYTVLTSEINGSAKTFCFMEYLGNEYVINGNGSAPYWHIFKLNNDGTITTWDAKQVYSGLKCDIRKKDNVAYYLRTSNEYDKRKLWLERDYDYNVTKSFALDSSVSTTKWEKYRLTIAPTVTWSVVDSIKVYDKEGEYYSECAVRDLNSWSNVANKTPYIDSTCILARYARKEKERDSFYNVCCWFANGDFTELENVQYTFKWLKTGFSWLESDVAYCSNWDWSISKNWEWVYVWKAVNPSSLIVDIDPMKNLTNIPVDIFAGKTKTEILYYTTIATRDETIRIYAKGRVYIWLKWVKSTAVYDTTYQYKDYTVSKWDLIKIGYERYDSDNWTEGHIMFF